MSLVSSVQSKTLTKCFALDIPKLLLQAKVMADRDFKFSSPEFSFDGLENEKYKGKITVGWVDGNRDMGINFIANLSTSGCVSRQVLVNVLITISVSVRDAKTGVLTSTLGKGAYSARITNSRSVCGILKKQLADLICTWKDEDEIRVSATVMLVYTPTKSDDWKQENSSAGFSEQTTPARSSYERPLAKRKKTDVTIVCRGIRFPVHSLVLSLVSPVFERMLEADMEEAASRRIVIIGFEPETVGRMIDFIYKGKLFSQEEAPSDESIIELLDCAEKYAIADLKKEVLNQICSRLTVNNAITYAKAVNVFNGDENTVAKILDFCKKNLPDFQKNSEKVLLENIEACT